MHEGGLRVELAQHLARLLLRRVHHLVLAVPRGLGQCSSTHRGERVDVCAPRDEVACAVQLTNRASVVERRPVLHFSVFDVDGSGKLSAQECMTILQMKNSGRALTLDDAKRFRKALG